MIIEKAKKGGGSMPGAMIWVFPAMLMIMRDWCMLMNKCLVGWHLPLEKISG